MAENAEDILREIKARKQAKKEGIEVKGPNDIETPPVVEIKKVLDNKDLKEVASRVEGRK